MKEAGVNVAERPSDVPGLVKAALAQWE
jgi:hypothetical protein